MDIYLTLAAAETAIELVDDTKLLAVFPFKESGTSKPKIVVIKKT